MMVLGQKVDEKVQARYIINRIQNFFFNIVSGNQTIDCGFPTLITGIVKFLNKFKGQCHEIVSEMSPWSSS
jgi:hypothetical protein